MFVTIISIVITFFLVKWLWKKFEHYEGVSWLD